MKIITTGTQRGILTALLLFLHIYLAITNPTYAVLLLILESEFMNGLTDAPNAIATVVSTGVLSLRKAVIMAAVLNIAGVLVGRAVATTIAKEIVNPSSVNNITIGATLISLILWSAITARWGIPTSESHALIAGLSGAAWATSGFKSIIWSGWIKVGIGLLMSSILGFVVSLILAKLVIYFFANSSPKKAGPVFNFLQMASSAFMAFNHGLNDGQKFMGIFVMTMVSDGMSSGTAIPLWVILLCAGVMGIGTSFGGKSIIKKTGMDMVEIEPWQGFCAEMASGMSIMLASIFGIPLSTSHSINTAIMGASAARRMSSVRWDIVGQLVTAWLVTFPLCGALSYGVTKVLLLF